VPWYGDFREGKPRDEANIIVNAFAAKKIDIGVVATHDGWIAYMYREGQLLVRERYLGEIREHLRGHAEVEVIKRVIRDIVLVSVTFPGSSRYADGGGSAAAGARHQAPLLRLLDDLDERLGPGIATPNHVVTTAGSGNPTGCPATEPQETYDPEPYPAVCPGRGGDGVRIYVADTGIVNDTVANCWWLQGVTGDPDPSVSDPALGPVTIQPYGGHGTFVAGVIRCLAPAAEIEVRCVFDVAGSGLEADFVPKLYAGFGFGAEIFHVTVASPTRCNLPLMAFAAWLEDLHQFKGAICIAPAGNSNSRLPFWPAAFDEIISVGALSTGGRSRAYFSDFGGWVDVYAPGENLVNVFPAGSYKCQISPYVNEVRTFSGTAQWSGTSFSTPIVTGLIAARMTQHGESAREAAAALLAQARAQAIPGVGPALFPGCEADEERCGRCDGGRGGGGGCGCSCGCGCGCGCGGGRGGGHWRRGPMPR
jgi:subtilisin family serine protease